MCVITVNPACRSACEMSFTEQHSFGKCSRSGEPDTLTEVLSQDCSCPHRPTRPASHSAGTDVLKPHGAVCAEAVGAGETMKLSKCR